MEQAADDRMPGPDSGCPGPGRSGGQVSGGQRVGGGGPRWPAGTRISQARPNAVGQSTAFAVILEDARMAELGQAARDEPIIFTPTNDSNPVPCRPQDAAEIDAGMADPYLTDCVHCKKTPVADVPALAGDGAPCGRRQTYDIDSVSTREI